MVFSNEAMVQSESDMKGGKKVSQVQFMAYVGLEIAMSFVKLNRVKDYWVTSECDVKSYV